MSAYNSRNEFTCVDCECVHDVGRPGTLRMSDVPRAHWKFLHIRKNINIQQLMTEIAELKRAMHVKKVKASASGDDDYDDD